jgi:hypothetical protein
MSNQVVGAVITGLAGLFGALAGGGFTYLASHETLKQQLGHEEQQQKLEARGVARVYVEQIYGANAILRSTLMRRRWPGRNDMVYFSLPAVEDRRLVQARLSSIASTRVDEADEAMRAVATILEIEPGQDLSKDARHLVMGWRGNLERGAVGLRELSR